MNTNKTNTYIIIIDGELDEQWADWFDGFDLSILGTQTHLHGTVRDQAALFGVLRKIHNLGLVLVSVVRQSANNTQKGE